MDASPLTVTVVLTQSADRRSWIATVVGNGRAVGLGPSPDIAVRELFHWSQITPAADAQPEEAVHG